MIIKEIHVESYISRSKLPDADYVINPYVGCSHKCIYCYAQNMKHITGHSSQQWGDFVDVKHCIKPIDISLFSEKDTVLFGSMTDAYNSVERKYRITRSIMEKMVDCDARIEVLTKSNLVLRDVDLFKRMKRVYVGISLCTTNMDFQKDIEPAASSVTERLDTLRELHENGIHTYLFMSPIFPGISECEDLLLLAAPYIDYVCFENLNLKGVYLPKVMNYVKNKYSHLFELYKKIYWNKDLSYWESLREQLSTLCGKSNIIYKFYFDHDRRNGKLRYNNTP